MFDTMTMTKIVGGLCGTFLVFLLGGFVAEFIYHPAASHDGEAHQAYTIPVDDGEEGGGEEVAEASFEEVFASADAASGERLFRQCQACHKVEDGANGTGPHLYGVVGRPVDAVDGYSYSGALEQVADVWTPENLNGFLENPKSFAPGTKMGYAGMKSVEDRANLIAWLDSLDG
ncbi:MAG: cytochrome c family protein [Silicimonas sp.]